MKCIKIFAIPLFILIFLSGCTQIRSNKAWCDQEAMIKAFEWQEQHPIFALAPTDWTNGAYYIGVTKACEATQDQRYLAALKTMGYQNQWKPFHRIYYADDIAISYSYLFISTTRKNLVDLEPTQNWLNAHLMQPNKWNIGNTKLSMQKTLWWWCDALFMAPPVISYYAKLTGEEQYLEKMHKFYRETYELLFDKEENLFARDLNYVWNGDHINLKEKNGEKIFWSRGNGWVFGGLALVIEELPLDDEHRPFYIKLFKKMASRIKDLQPNDGLWRTSLLYPEPYPHGEVSGSGLFTFALAWGINNGLLNKQDYEPAVLNAWKALRECQHDNGMIGWVQNIGDSPKPVNKDSWQNYGTGAFLLAGSEVLKLDMNK